MVLTNIATANGMQGEVVDFKLDPRNGTKVHCDPKTGAIMLRYPPVVVLFKPDECTFPPSKASLLVFFRNTVYINTSLP
ncbi:hypothetical protein DFH09DRAFT_1328992 [Mycena vulgaris]|nr:hypothetical protein DFH09DRAFT_1328992 [Mycena vulgaris]